MTSSAPGAPRHRVVRHTARVEQRIGSSNQPLDAASVNAASVNPAYIPGLTPPVSPKPAKGTGDTEGTEPDEATPPDEATEPAGATEPEPEPEGAGTAAAASEGSVKKPDEESDEEPAGKSAGDADEKPAEDAGEEPEGDRDTPDGDGPVFDASDRRARIVADHRGVRLSLDDQECEFRWDEIGALETETARFGKRFTVTVHTSDRRWYPIEIEAASRSRFAEWDARLDEVLDAYFEDGEDSEES